MPRSLESSAKRLRIRADVVPEVRRLFHAKTDTEAIHKALANNEHRAHSSVETRPGAIGVLVGRVMARLNLTLDEDTLESLKKHARRLSRPAASLARELLDEGIRRRETAERRRMLAKDYAAGRRDVRVLLKDLEGAQFDLLDNDEA